MKDLKASLELTARANVDLQALRELVGNPRVADEIFGFLAQQAVEKSMKAWLALLGKQYPVTHNLQQLSNELQDAGIKVSSFGDFTTLNPFAVQFRYETMDISEPELDRPAILRMVQNLVKKVQELVDKTSENGPPGAHEKPAAYRTEKSAHPNRGRVKKRRTVGAKKK